MVSYKNKYINSKLDHSYWNMIHLNILEFIITQLDIWCLYRIIMFISYNSLIKLLIRKLFIFKKSKTNTLFILNKCIHISLYIMIIYQYICNQLYNYNS